jgi:hypothetical protein
VCIVAAVALGCGTHRSPPAAVATPSASASRPAPASLPTSSAAAAPGAPLVPLTTDGKDQAIAQFGTNALDLLRPSDKKPLAHVELSWTTPHIASGYAVPRLLDLDGDGRYELVVWHTDGDDTGVHESSEVLAWHGDHFEASQKLHAPAQFRNDVIGQALTKSIGKPTEVFTSADLHAVSGRDQVPAPGLGAAPRLAWGHEVAVLAFVAAKPGGMPARWIVAMIHAYDTPKVVSSLELGTADIAPDAKACLATGVTLLGDELDVVYQDASDSAVEQLVRWKDDVLTADGDPRPRQCRP